MNPSTVLRPRGRARRIGPWMALGVVALLAGLWAALILLGLPVPHTALPLAAAHGPLMALAFLGTLISAERAVALGRWWAFLAPAAAGLGGLATIAGAPFVLGPALLTFAGLALVAVFLALYQLQPAVHTAVMTAGAACWPVAAGLWLAGWDVPRFVPWLAGFLVLTIAGERLELSRVAITSEPVRRVLVALSGALLTALVLSLWTEDLGVRLAGAALIGVAGWLLRYDVARRTIRIPGLTRYMAAALLAGYVWLAAGGALWLAVGRMADGSAYDAMLHSIFLGFVMSMVFAHAPVIVPAVLGVRLPYRRVFYVHLALLHLSLLVRLLGGDALGNRLAWQVGGVLNEVALLLFLVVTAVTVVRSRRSARPATAAPEAPGARGSVLRDRASWHLVANAVVVGYLVAAVATVPFHVFGSAPRWLVIHLFALGAVTNAIVVWSRHFTITLLHLPEGSRRAAGWQLAALNAAVVAVLTGVTTAHPIVTVAAASALAVVIGWHLLGLVRAGRRALGGRFTPLVGFYRAAAVALLAGIGLGSALAFGVPAPWEPRLYAAHVHLNLLGWVALTILGTQFALWPTILRTRMVEGIVPTARRSLALTGAGLLALLVGLLLAVPAVVVLGLVGYSAGAVLALDPFVRTARQKTPRSTAAWLMAAGTGWLVVALAVDLGGQVFNALAATHPAAGAADAVARIVPLLLVGFVAQVLLGALTYLVPVVLGRGPADGRRLSGVLDRFGAARVVALNVGVALVAVGTGAGSHGPRGVAARVGWGLVVVAVLAFVGLLLTAVLFRTPPATSGAEVTSRHTGHRAVVGGLAIGLVMLLVAVGIALSGRGGTQPVADGSSRPAASSASAAAERGTRVVPITLANMDIAPGTITVPRGTHVVLEVTNKDPMRHDLAFPGGPRTRMLQMGDHQRLDLGTVQSSREGWCTVPGHKEAGMTLQVNVTGRSHDMAGMAVPNAASGADRQGATRDARLNPAAMPSPSFHPRSAVLPPVPAGRLHHVTLRAVDKVLEVAPGVRQRMWTFNGTVPGPILHGRVGDTFVVTLRNESAMGHSIDFHASEVSPDRAMRTVPPGGQLTFRFTARHSGAWMYHCATEPMLQHIGNGMYGAVVIDPPHLPPVDHQWVLVQSELYLGPQGQHGDFTKMAQGTPDAVVFNGYVDQYHHFPLRARAGDRVRFWVVDDGLVRPSSFHVVGTQFDTVFKEGAYLLRRGNAEKGAAQALDLEPGEGGFVELTLPAPGHYPVLDHVMVDAARGAHGSITVTR
ncbi:MAG TPA: multicopper oxidase domain-containing protein [Segeticoccus sp.]|uniref:multicopper oxidase domain-containing protein n=1 Tax=Segeticoccus sp. TaxID=2706531 RepID=UPI002D7F76DB|nr:multicopper oxidase domain-containing protein [Segeticoccus sp.]HET8600222.1 multicopper oxidase domain-containing protein [Segeticoccus sp.]